MTDEEKAALAWLDGYAQRLGSYRGHARTLKAMLAQPRLPDADHMPGDAVHAMGLAAPLVTMNELKAIVRALYAHLTIETRSPGISTSAEQPKSNAAVEPTRKDGWAGERDLRAAISVLRGWSAEAAGRTGLAESVLIVCNAAEATLPVQFYRIRAKGLDAVHAGPVSISEVPHDQ